MCVCNVPSGPPYFIILTTPIEKFYTREYNTFPNKAQPGKYLCVVYPVNCEQVPDRAVARLWRTFKMNNPETWHETEG